MVLTDDIENGVVRDITEVTDEEATFPHPCNTINDAIDDGVEVKNHTGAGSVVDGIDDNARYCVFSNYLQFTIYEPFYLNTNCVIHHFLCFPSILTCSQSGCLSLCYALSVVSFRHYLGKVKN